MIASELVKSLASDAKRDLFEGGSGSGNWGHKGRPGHRGGSAARGSGVSTHVTGGGVGIPYKANFGGATGTIAVTKQSKAAGNLPSKSAEWKAELAAFRARQAAGGKGGKNGGGTHVVKPGVHASTFYDKSGALKTNEYKKLTDNQKTSVLSHGIQKYKEQYVPKSKQGSMSEAEKSANKKVGALEGMRRAAISKANGFARGSKEWRGATHVAISLQQQVGKVIGTTKSQVSGTAATAVTAARQAGAQPGR